MTAIIRREVFAGPHDDGQGGQTEGALEAFCLPTFEYVVALNRPAVLTDAGRVAFPEPVRYPVMAVGTAQGRKIAAQGAPDESRSTWEYIESDQRCYDRGPNSGERPACYTPDGTLIIEPGGPEHPTEGWAGTGLDGAPVRIVRFDPVRDIHELTEIGPFTIGQSSLDGEQAGMDLLFDGKRYRVEDGNVHTIWFVLGANGVMAIATRKLQPQNETVCLWLDVNKITELPLAPTKQQPPIIVVPPKEPDPPKEKDPMQFTARQQEIVQQLYERHLEWANSQNDDDRRKLAKVIAEQFRAEFGEDWGWKSNHGNTENDSPGKDAIAKKRGPYTPGRQMLWIFDLFDGTTRKPNTVIRSVPEEESNQFFIPVDPVNHLGTPVEPPKEPDGPKPPDGDLAAQFAKLAADFNAFGGRLSAVERVGDANAAELVVGRKRDSDLAARITVLEKPGTGTGGGSPIPADLAKQIAAELLKLLSKAAA